MARTAAKLSHVSEAMKQWCALLETELLSWPQVTFKPMFGMVGFYRKDKIFAAIPRNRTVGNTDAVLVKLQGASEKLVAKALGDPRTITTVFPKAGWIAMALDSLDDARAILRWFSQAYELAGKQGLRKNKKKSGRKRHR